MIGDYFNIVSGRSGTPQSVTATAVSQDVIDRRVSADWGPGRRPMFSVQPMTSLTPTRVDVTVTLSNTNDLVNLTAHGLPRGTPVVFSGAALPTATPAIARGTIYYVVPVSGNANAFNIATSLANAMAGTIIAIDADSSGTITLTAIPTLEIQLIGSDNADLSAPFQVLGSTGPLQPRVTRFITTTHASDLFNLVAHGFVTGTPVVFGGAGTLPTNITAGVTYYVVYVTADTFKVATSLANAQAGTVVNITADAANVVTVQVRDNLLNAGGPALFVEGRPQWDNILGARYIGLRYVLTDGPVTSFGVTGRKVMNEAQRPPAMPVGYDVP